MYVCDSIQLVLSGQTHLQYNPHTPESLVQFIDLSSSKATSFWWPIILIVLKWPKWFV